MSALLLNSPVDLATSEPTALTPTARVTEMSDLTRYSFSEVVPSVTEDWVGYRPCRSRDAYSYRSST